MQFRPITMSFIHGDRVATGVYIYKVTAFSMNNDDVVESFGKVVVIN